MDLLVLTPRAVNTEAVDRTPGLRALPYDPASPEPSAEALEAEAIIVQTEHAEPTLQLMARLPKLRLVQTLSAGIDRWDGNVPAGVAISNARGAHGRATAELTVTMLLAIYREIREFDEDQSIEDWAQRTTDSLAGKRVLVLGAGDLGQHVRAMLLPFGAEPTLVGRRGRGKIVGIDDIGALLPETDAVIAVLPLSSETHHLIDEDFLAALPDGAVVINAGRGPLVETDALVAELQSGRLRAGLDVTDPEPLPAGHPLWQVPGLLLTPHVGGDTLGNEKRSAQVAADQIAQLASGKSPANLVSGSVAGRGASTHPA